MPELTLPRCQEFEQYTLFNVPQHVQGVLFDVPEVSDLQLESPRSEIDHHSNLGIFTAVNGLLAALAERGDVSSIRASQQKIKELRKFGMVLSPEAELVARLAVCIKLPPRGRVINQQQGPAPGTGMYL